MTRGGALLAKLTQIMALVTELPVGAEVAVTWEDAPPDLLLVLAQQNGGELRSYGQVDEAEWTCGSLRIRAQRTTPPISRTTLTLVKP
jgi:hypothetical protein